MNHDWKRDDNVEACDRPGCTVRRSPLGSHWQAKRGAPWRSISREPIPDCAAGTCSATWLGGRCDRDAVTKGLCLAHYRQQGRGRPFTAIRGPGGADPRELVSVTIQVPAAHADDMTARAGELGVTTSEAYRVAVGEWLKKSA